MQNIDLYPLMCTVLGTPCHNYDGDLARIQVASSVHALVMAQKAKFQSVLANPKNSAFVPTPVGFAFAVSIAVGLLRTL